VGTGLILENTFLMDLERETLRLEPGGAHAFLQRHEAAPAYLTFTVAGELATGCGVDGRGRWEELVAPFHVLPCNRDVSWHYGQAERHLRANGMLIGANDLWIGATAVAYCLPVVARNIRPLSPQTGARGHRLLTACVSRSLWPVAVAHRAALPATGAAGRTGGGAPPRQKQGEPGASPAVPLARGRQLDPSRPSLRAHASCRTKLERLGSGTARVDRRSSCHDDYGHDHGHDGGSTMRTMKASEFKAKCLKVMDEVAETGEPVVVTKNGDPVSRVEAYRERPGTLFGRLAGAIEITGEIVGPLDVEWEAGS